MKKRIGLLLFTAIIITTFSGCMVKKEASSTGETSKEITIEFTPEITKEPVKEQPDVNNNLDNKNTDNTNQNSTQPNENDNKTEPTPEFYDFMSLDPDVDINNEQVRDDIYKRISYGTFYENYIKNNKMNFTKKENYLYELYDEESFTKYSRIDYYIKPGTTDFYSLNTKKKLADLGFEFEIHDNNDNPFITYSQKGFPDYSKEEYIYKLKEAFKILLEDHNVTYAEISIYASSDV